MRTITRLAFIAAVLFGLAAPSPAAADPAPTIGVKKGITAPSDHANQYVTTGAFTWRVSAYQIKAWVCSTRLTTAAIKYYPNFQNHQNPGEGYRVLIAANTCKELSMATRPERPGAPVNHFQVTTSHWGELGNVLHVAQWPVGAW